MNKYPALDESIIETVHTGMLYKEIFKMYKSSNDKIKLEITYE